MENETKKEKNLPPIVSIIIVAALISGAWIYTARLKSQEILWHPARLNPQDEISLKNGTELPVRWGDMGVKMTEAGVIDKEKFENLYSGRGGLSESDKKLLYNSDNGNLVINSENSGVMLNMLWALGLGNKNPILTEGPMVTYGDAGLPADLSATTSVTAEALAKAGNFASTGGWTLAKGNAMAHYGMHSFITLTPEQQMLIEKVSKDIYRPCCDNSTYFPDCNHGMAMLGLLELMASQGVSETDMYKVALQVNTLWFPGQYKAVAVFFKSKNMDWNTADPKKILSAEFSSASGYQGVLSQIQPQEQKGGGSCGA